ncbi:MAG: CDP-diacylglycerol--glycerol-3-phosphate 3-phosphatidyltransferase [Oscillospiraceae bacterium]|nr:CDP-diacylglycerol--glycerol-3-phosphate 3-phosphatidyltransferase [Oscillospiraceae bacterium]
MSKSNRNAAKRGKSAQGRKKIQTGKKIPQKPKKPIDRVKSAVKGVLAINLANKLTIARILLVPVFMLFLAVSTIPHHIMIALFIFALASVTDWLDGHIARTRMMITPFGQFLDPIADKILVMSALVLFAGNQWISGWVVAVILGRDFIVSAVRLVAVQSEEKLIIPARASGKVKTVITMVSIGAILFMWGLNDYGLISVESETIYGNVDVKINSPRLLLVPLGNVFMYICAGLNIYSGAQYIWDARYMLKDELGKKM